VVIDYFIYWAVGIRQLVRTCVEGPQHKKGGKTIDLLRSVIDDYCESIIAYA